MSLKKIILHPGLPKTGTTSIQDTLYFNHRILARNGFIFMTEWGNANHGTILYNLFHQPPNVHYWFNSLNHFDEKAIIEQNEYNIKKLQDIVEQYSCHTLILSGEDLIDSNLNSDSLIYMQTFFERHFNGVEIEVVFYVRNPIHMLVSLYQEAVVNNDDIRARELIFSQNIIGNRYLRRMADWLSLFGSQVKVYKFEDALQCPNGLVGHFLTAIGFPAEKIKSFDMKRTNESRSMEAIEFIGALNRQEPYFITTNLGRIENPNRKYYVDLTPIFLLSGPKFNLAGEDQENIVKLAQNNIQLMEVVTGIHYDSIVKSPTSINIYGQEVIEQFKIIFPMLTQPLQEAFLNFFEKKHQQSGDEKFKQLFSPGSTPWKLFEYTKQWEKLFKADPSLRKTHRIVYDHIDTVSPVDSVLLYIDFDGAGYSFKDSIIILPNKENRLVIKRTFSPKDNVKALRLHPSYFACIAIIKTFVINGKEEKCKFTNGNYDDHFSDTYVFIRDCPILEFTYDESITSIDLELIVDIGTYPFSFCVRKWGTVIDQHLIELNKQANADQEQIAQLTTQAKADQEQIAQLTTQVESDQQKLVQLELRLECLEATLNRVRAELVTAKTMKGSVKNFILVFFPPNSRRRAVMKHIYFVLRGWPHR